jgi:hypothetical protein
MNDDYEFTWYYPAEAPGFRWVDAVQAFGPKETQPVLFSLPRHGPRPYRPMDEPGLYLKFADLRHSLTTDAVLEFVSRYGPLGVRDVVTRLVGLDHGERVGPVLYPGDRVPEDERERKSFSRRGEAFAAWREQILRMGVLTELWGLATARDRDALRRFVEWEGGEFVIRWPAFQTFDLDVRWEKGEARFANRLSGGPLCKPGDLITPAMKFVQEEIDSVLVRHAARERLGWSAAGRRPELFRRPDDLLSALFLQFAFAAANPDGLRLSHCRQCGKRMWLGAGIQRTDATTCSDGCRTLLSRRRRQARRLHAEGKSIKSIAKQLKAEAVEVKTWLSEGR